VQQTEYGELQDRTAVSHQPTSSNQFVTT
jgi:hypothetical protein